MNSAKLHVLSANASGFLDLQVLRGRRGSILLRTGKKLLPEELAVARRYPHANTLTQTLDWVLKHSFVVQREKQLSATCA